MTDEMDFDREEGTPAPIQTAGLSDKEYDRQFDAALAADERRGVNPPIPPADLAAGPAPLANVEAEAACLGACMYNAEAADKVLLLLGHADFYKGAHARIFDVVQDLRAVGAQVDLVAVQEKLSARGHLAFVGGAVALAELTEKVASVANVEAYCRIVREKAQLRRLEAAAYAILADCRNRQEEASAVLDEASERILQVAEVHGTDFEMVGAGWEEDFEALAASSRGEKPLGMATGLVGIDRLTGGAMAGKTWVIGGRPGEGKTALMLNIADRMADRGIPVLFFSLEMETRDLRGRIVAARADIDGNKIERGRLDPEELETYKATLNAIRKAPLYIYRDPDLTLQKLMAMTRVAISKYKVRAIFIDYLQLLRDPDRRYSSLAQETTAICRDISQRLGRKHKIAVFEAAQLNRDMKDGDEPKVRHLKESGGIEENADVIALLYDKHDKDYAGQPITPIELILGKHRGGDVGRVELQYTRRFLRFESFE